MPSPLFLTRYLEGARWDMEVHLPGFRVLAGLRSGVAGFRL